MLDSAQSLPVRRLGWSVRKQTFALAVMIVLLDSDLVDSNGTVIMVEHLPTRFSRRAGDITANVSGRILSSVSKIRYRVNDGQWQITRQEGPRVHKPLFCIEIDPRMLHTGRNTIQINASSRFGGTIGVSREFNYDPAPVRLPVQDTWAIHRDLDVESGIWETIAGANGPRLRPKPGFEDYDRIVIAAGAFPGGRRVTTDVIFRSAKSEKQAFGFGVLPFWGGRPDDPAYSPRRGWNFSIAWYYSTYKGVGEEFSWKKGNEPPRWISSYRNFDLEPGVRYTIIVEAQEVVDGSGRHRKYNQRLQWRRDSDHEVPWIELSDDGGGQIPAGEYAVGLVAHRCQVEFGPVLIEPLAPETEQERGAQLTLASGADRPQPRR